MMNNNHIIANNSVRNINDLQGGNDNYNGFDNYQKGYNGFINNGADQARNVNSQMDNTRFGQNLQQMGGMLHMNNMNNGMSMN